MLSFSVCTTTSRCEGFSTVLVYVSWHMMSALTPECATMWVLGTDWYVQLLLHDYCTLANCIVINWNSEDVLTHTRVLRTGWGNGFWVSWDLNQFVWTRVWKWYISPLRLCGQAQIYSRYHGAITCINYKCVGPMTPHSAVDAAIILLWEEETAFVIRWVSSNKLIESTNPGIFDPLVSSP